MRKIKANVLKGLGIFCLTALLITSIVAVSITISNQNVDNTEIKGVTDIEIKKHANDTADVILKIKSSIKHLDDD